MIWSILPFSKICLNSLKSRYLVGAIHILLVNKEGEETFCTSINTDLIYLLDRYTIRCQETRSTANLGSDTVAIKMIPSKVDQSAPKLEITEGHARFILTDKRRQINSVSEIPIRPEEFFGKFMRMVKKIL